MTKDERRVLCDILDIPRERIEVVQGHVIVNERRHDEEPLNESYITPNLPSLDQFDWLRYENQEGRKLGRPPEGEVPSTEDLTPEDRGLSEECQDSSSMHQILSPETPAEGVNTPLDMKTSIEESTSPPPRDITFEEFLRLFAQTGELQAWLGTAEVWFMDDMTMKKANYVTIEGILPKFYLL
jgi:hypothetical protein